MILIVSQHKSEVDSLLDVYKPCKSMGLYKNENIAFFINYPHDSLSLGYSIIKLHNLLDFKIVILFGSAGSLSNNLKKGDIVFVNKTVLIDNSLHPVFNPISLKEVNGFKHIFSVSLLNRPNLNIDVLKYFGDIVDYETYFFAKFTQMLNIVNIVIKVITDYNTKDEILSVRNNKLVFDNIEIITFINELIEIEKDNLSLEIFRHTGLHRLNTLNGIERLVINRHLSFSERQNLYNNIKISKSKHEDNGFNDSRLVLIEKDVDLNRINFNFNNDNFKKAYIDDYVSYLHNLKDNNAIIFANKRGEFLRKTPTKYTPDGSYGYSIVNAYNCLFDCSYCFLKGYFRSFNPVIFVNFEDFFDSIERVLKKDKKRPLYFFAGTFSDSLVFSNLTNFTEKLIEFFDCIDDNVHLELRTKSSNLNKLTKIKNHNNTIISVSLSPRSVIYALEKHTSSLDQRMSAILTLLKHEYRVGIRIDPIILDYMEDYDEVFNFINELNGIESVEIGYLRFDKKTYKRFLHSQNRAILNNLVFSNAMYRYSRQRIEEFEKRYKQYFRSLNFYKCMEF